MKNNILIYTVIIKKNKLQMGCYPLLMGVEMDMGDHDT